MFSLFHKSGDERLTFIKRGKNKFNKTILWEIPNDHFPNFFGHRSRIINLLNIFMVKEVL